MKKWFTLLFFALVLSTQPSFAAYQSTFDALNFVPAVDGGDYFTIYGSDTLARGQGHIGAYFDYADRPLQFTGTGALLGQRQSVIDHLLTLNSFGAIGVTDWFSVGIDVPAVMYNWFYSDLPEALPTAAPDKAPMMGDLQVVSKFRLVNIEKGHFGLALVPYATLPTGDTTRFTGNGNVTGGLTIASDVTIGKRVSLAANVGGTLRDDVTKHGVRVDDQLTYGLGANFKLDKSWQAIVEGFGSTVIRNFFESDSSPLEAGAGIRHYFGDSGIAADLGGNVGLMDGVGSPRYRVFTGLKYTSSVKECAAPIAPPLPPDPRIKGNKIVLWGKIFYDTDKTTIKPVSFPVLDDVVDVMNKNQQILLVEVQGHTDARASDAYNLRLSQGRAESAMKYLISKGIAPSRLKAVGYGESQPIASNNTVEGMSQNRRTEFVILSSTTGEFKSSTAPNGVSQGIVMPASAQNPASIPVATTVTTTTTTATSDLPNYSSPAPKP